MTMVLVLPYGRYRGYPVSEVSPAYLLLILSSWDWSRLGHLHGAVVRQLEERLPRWLSAQGVELEVQTTGRVLTTEVIQSWFRQLAMKYHGDRAGSDLAMSAINEAASCWCSCWRMTTMADLPYGVDVAVPRQAPDVTARPLPQDLALMTQRELLALIAGRLSLRPPAVPVEELEKVCVGGVMMWRRKEC